MKVLELFAGSRSVGKAAEKLGMEVFSSDINNFEGINYVVNILEFDYDKVPFKPDVIWASPPCFTGNELVLTMRGHVEIKNVRIGDLVLTHKGRWRKVINIGRKHSNVIRKLKGHGVDEIRCTENHPFYVRNKNTRTTRKKGSSVRINEWSDAYWDEAKNIVSKYWSTPIQIEKFNHFVLINPYIIGRWLGDGWLSLERGEVCICCNKNEFLELKTILENDGFKWIYSEGKSTYRFTLCDKNVTNYLFSNFGIKAKGKKIPGWVYGETELFRENLLMGYLDSDGYKKNDNIFSFSSVSRNLSYGICFLSKTLGYTYNLRKNKKRTIPHYIENRKIKENDSWSGIISKTNKTNNFFVSFDDGLGYSKVKSIETKTHNSWVYDIEVEEDHSYTINNIVVHNCTGFSVAALGRNWSKTGEIFTPKTDTARLGVSLVEKTLEIINHYKPKYWFMENPRGVLRKLDVVKDLKRNSVTYCQYGDERMKPTDIWTNSDIWVPRPTCKNGDKCHVAAPRGSRTGTQGLANAYERSKIPDALCEEVLKSCL
jgi:hypothetical protein